MFQFLNNVPPVTKNLLFLNVLFYIVSLVLSTKGIDLISILGGHYINSMLFEPYQIVTHFFMHSPRLFHILFNMIALVMFGSLLERMWGAKRFFIFYIASALGAFLLYNAIGFYEIMQMKKQIIMAGYDLEEINESIRGMYKMNTVPADPLLYKYAIKSYIPMVGASGAIFGIMAAFAYLFPNTEMMLMFIPFPVKAKYLVGGYFLIEVYLSFQNNPGDSTAHLAHVGGAVVGFILVYIWNRNRKTFY